MLPRSMPSSIAWRRPTPHRRFSQPPTSTFTSPSPALSGNPFFRTASALIEVALAATFAITTPVNDPKAKAASCAAHRRVVTSIGDGDGDAAAAAIVETIRSGAARVAAAAGR